MRDKTCPYKQWQTLQHLCRTVLKQGRRSSEMSSLFHSAFWSLFATLSSKCTLFCTTPISPLCQLLQVLHKSSLLSGPADSLKHPLVLKSGTWPILLAVPPAPVISPRIFFFKISLDLLTWVLLCSPCPYCALLPVCTHGDVSSEVPVTPWLQNMHHWCQGQCCRRSRRVVRASLVAEGRRTCERMAGGMGRVGP